MRFVNIKHNNTVRVQLVDFKNDRKLMDAIIDKEDLMELLEHIEESCKKAYKREELFERI